MRFRQGFQRRFITSSREFPCFFFGFFVHLFDHFIGVFHYSVSQSKDSNEELFLTQNYLSQEVLEPNFSMGCNVGEIGNDLASDPQTLSTTI